MTKPQTHSFSKYCEDVIKKKIFGVGDEPAGISTELLDILIDFSWFSSVSPVLYLEMD